MLSGVCVGYVANAWTTRPDGTVGTKQVRVAQLVLGFNLLGVARLCGTRVCCVVCSAGHPTSDLGLSCNEHRGI